MLGITRSPEQSTAMRMREILILKLFLLFADYSLHSTAHSVLWQCYGVLLSLFTWLFDGGGWFRGSMGVVSCVGAGGVERMADGFYWLFPERTD